MPDNDRDQINFGHSNIQAVKDATTIYLKIYTKPAIHLI